MSWLSRLTRQTATYWAPGREDGFGGGYWGTPTSVKVRWSSRSRPEEDDFGERTIKRPVVFLDSTDVEEGGYLYLGTSTEVDPRAVTGAKRIVRVDRVYDVRGKLSLAAATLEGDEREDPLSA